ncbi:uncharacterized mitochondrial protein AtMg00810-like [Nicotiana sylvestris]|uniref:uncharacterized mitochondrial protein AtMg00810-like n=1 Tax=Nicotiana sylvestris TaxID=4096 RepID=UPI00388C9AE9
MGSEFEMSMMGELNFFLGLQVKQSTKGTFICQQKYIKEILKRGIIGSLIYLTAIRTNIVFSVGLCARYADADYAGYLVDRKSISRMAHFLGSCLISWGTRKQNSVALSTAEAEYVAAASCCAQLLWIK